MNKLRTYVMGKHGLSEDEFHAHIRGQQALRDRVGLRHEAGAAAHRLGAVLASHDDTDAGQVAESKAHGARIAEFPTTLEAAQACRDHGIAVMMGAPNLIPGGLAFRQRRGGGTRGGGAAGRGIVGLCAGGAARLGFRAGADLAGRSGTGLCLRDGRSGAGGEAAGPGEDRGGGRGRTCCAWPRSRGTPSRGASGARACGWPDGGGRCPAPVGR